MIVQLTTQCAQELGWYGWDPIVGSYDQSPFHNQQTCAGNVILVIARFARAASDGCAAAFSCANDNQACGQSVAQVVRSVSESAQALTLAAGFCGPVQGGSQYEPVQGFKCFRWIWHAIERLIRGGKFIDIAFTECENLHTPVPRPSAVAPQSGHGAVRDGEHTRQRSSLLDRCAAVAGVSRRAAHAGHAG